ncbi:MAG: endonuclease domain-containing protein [Candidatus Dojkabacteria bacterium]|nr:endonuclease domain-containing protein [Candidatus Dojkabacteria bacterium]MDQ7021078.1 endonuclease domain-containing protein [Candidatus Dojkabacteria bacterium]
MKYKNSKYNKNLKIFSRKNRQKQTPAEIKLWSKLRNRQLNNFKFYRQRAIDKYIVDFFCKEYNFIIEIDGASHDDNKYEYDRGREKRLSEIGYKMLRFTEFQVVSSVDDVLQSIKNFIDGVWDGVSE